MTTASAYPIPDRSATDWIKLDHAHVWHPFTPMDHWRQQTPMVIEAGEGFHLIDSEGNRYIDGVSSLWCNVHGHRVPAIDQAVRAQLDRIAHSTLLGLTSPPSIELAARLAAITPGKLNKVFYSDAGATAVEAGLKMAVGYWFHKGKPTKNQFIALGGAYHGDTTGAMAVGYSELFHRPFASMLFKTHWTPAPDSARAPEPVIQKLKDMGMKLCADCQGQGLCGLDAWPSTCLSLNNVMADWCIEQLEAKLKEMAHLTAGIIVEPLMQGAAGMVSQPPGFLKRVAELAMKYEVLLVADEVATGFGRTAAMFACDHEKVEPDIMCLAKGISAGYLPLAATIVTDEVEQAFAGPLEARRTFFHGHTYTGNPLACAAALASLDLFEQSPPGSDAPDVISHAKKSASIIGDRLQALSDCPHVLDIRRQGLMTGIEICKDRGNREPFDFAARMGHAVCDAMRPKGLIIRPLGDVVILMPAPAMPHDLLNQMLDIVVQTISDWKI